MPECSEIPPKRGEVIRKCYRPLANPKTPENYPIQKANEGRLTIGAFDSAHDDESNLVAAAMKDPTAHLDQIRSEVIDRNVVWVRQLISHRDNRLGETDKSDNIHYKEELIRIWDMIVQNDRPGWRQIVKPLTRRAGVRDEWLWWHLSQIVLAFANTFIPPDRARLLDEWNKYELVHGRTFPQLDTVLDIHRETRSGIQCRLLAIYRSAFNNELDTVIVIS